MMLLISVLACSPHNVKYPWDTSSETCVPAMQYAARGQLGTDLAGVSYCWDTDSTRGRWDRDDAPTCTSDPGELIAECSVSEPEAPCASDADCGGGQCTSDGYTSCECVSTCASGGDCVADESCLCGSAVEDGVSEPALWSMCLPSECGSSADCGGSPCGLTQNHCQQAAGFYCHTSADACLWDSDCPSNGRCLYNVAGQPDAGLWTCQEMADCE